MPEDKFEKIALYFLELASEQRLEILDSLVKKPFGVSELAKKMNVTAQEIHRNFNRLGHKGFIRKETDDKYRITSTGRILYAQMSLMNFISKNRKFFQSHNTDNLNLKFVKRLGVLEECERIKGVTAVLDKWTSIYENASDYVLDIISESPPGSISPLLKNIKNGIYYRHIIPENFLEPEDREKLLKKNGYYKMIEEGKIERHIAKDVDIIFIINEKEAGIIFPTLDKEPDLKHMFYGNDPLFHELCLDYFEYKWKKSRATNRTSPKK